MPSKLSIETSDKQKPTILIFPNKNPLADFLISNYENDFKIIEVTEDNRRKTKQNYYRVNPKSAHLIKNLEERIDYAVIFLSETKEKKTAFHIFEKLNLDKTKTVIILELDKIDSFYDLILATKQNTNFFYIILGEIFSLGKAPFSDSNLSKIIANALTKRAISISGDELSPIFTIYFKDAIIGINQILFSESGKNKLFYLFYKDPQTLISMVHLLKRAEPELELIFDKKKGAKVFKKSIDQLTQQIKSKLLLSPIYIDKYLSGFESSLNDIEVSEIEKTIARGVQKKISFSFPKINFYNLFRDKRRLRPFLYSFLIYIFIVLLSGGLAFFYLRSSALAFEKGEILEAGRNAQKANIFLNLLEPNVEIASFIGNLVYKNNLYIKYSDLQKMTRIFEENVVAFEKHKAFSQENLQALIANLNYSYFEISRLKNENVHPVFKKLDLKILSKLLSTSQVASNILGGSGEKNYLILFQNNNELRPGGGFVGSIGEISISNGKITNYNLEDVYSLDGQLKAHVEPHYIIRRYLQPHLYLRDSNFHLDFSTSASYSALLYDLERGKKVDGVIAVNALVLKEVVEKIGPINLVSYSQTIDSSNILTFLENTIEENFFPGSTEKRDILNELLDKMLLKLEDKKNLILVLNILPQLINEKHIQFSFEDKAIESTFIANGFAGSMRDLRSITEKSLNDFLAISEANIGVNKSNRNLSRSIEYENLLSDKELNSKLILNYTNSGSDMDYKVYIRVYTPILSELTSIKIGGQQQEIVPAVVNFSTYEAENFQPPRGLEVDNFIESGKQSFGFVTTVGKNEKQTIEIEYKNGLNIINNSPIVYSLLFIKQPGTNNYPFKMNFSYTDDFLLQHADNATFEDKKVTVNDNINSDKKYNIQLVRKGN